MEEEDAPPCPFIIAGVERPLESMLSMSMRVLLILKHTNNDFVQKPNVIHKTIKLRCAPMCVCVSLPDMNSEFIPISGCRKYYEEFL